MDGRRHPVMRVRCRAAMARVPPPGTSPEVEEEILSWWIDRTRVSREAAAARSGRPRSWPILLAAALLTAGILVSGFVLLRPDGERAPGPPDRPLMVERAEDAALESSVRSAGPASRETRELAEPGLSRSAPRSLRIPSIGVRSGRLLRLGLADDGSVQVPPLRKTDRAGWYEDGPSPGEVGPAVIVGHVDSAARGPGVFFNLRKVREGDKIKVSRADGAVAVFTAESVRRVAKKRYPHRRVHGDLDYPGLRLISCGGRFDRAKGAYRDSVIVYARLTGVRRP